MKNILKSEQPLTSRQWAVDIAIAVAAFAFGCAQLAITSSTTVIRDDSFRDMVGIVTMTPDWTAYLALAATTLPLVVRRRYTWPVFVFVLVLYFSVQETFRGFSLSVVGVLVALFSVCEQRTRTEAAVACFTALCMFAAVPMDGPNLSMAFMLRLQNLSYAALAAVAGFALRANRGYVHETEQRALAAEKGREEEAARRVEAERVRIAREVHDITAHSLSAVSIQAAAAEKLIDRDPAAAKQAVASIRSTSKDALDEIRSMIGVLRNETNAETAPTEGTERLADVVTFLHEAGLSVSVDDSSYDRGVVPAYVDVALFTVAREAATNIVRHAQASSVRIVIETDGGAAILRMEDDGHGFDMRTARSGHGLQGMEERVRVLGGTFEAGNRAGGGFGVRACIPLTAKETT